MRSRLGWFLGGLGFAAAVARFFRGGTTAAPSLPAPAPALPRVPSPEREPWPEPEPEPEPEPALEAEEPALEAEEPGAEAEEPGADPRAEELRRRLDESRALVDEREEFESGETTIDHVEATTYAAPEASPDDRRRHVHERGQAAIDRMKREPG
jgi:hypothetical protein